MVWASNDMKLVTCGEDGAIYEFNTRSGERDMDIVHPKTIYMDLALSNDTNQIFPAAQDGRFREIYNQSVRTMFITKNIYTRLISDFERSAGSDCFTIIIYFFLSVNPFSDN